MPVSRISIELVPRSSESLEGDLGVLREEFKSIQLVNIPDILRYELRSWEACRQAREAVPCAIPHLRAMDFDLNNLVLLKEVLGAGDLGEVLVVQGDPPQDLVHRVYPTKSVDLIRAIKSLSPQVKVYAAIDPYRNSFRKEMAYVEAKIDAGADGFFTQPFFDLGLMGVWADLLRRVDVFWGISPVISKRTKRYWETKNKAVFPSTFEPTLDWNRRFAKEALSWAQSRSTNIYFMPIRLDLMSYLGGIL
ncbi:MAG: methylenetetrahydrofolate reductase [Nitrospiria bacterium]